jgi:hypothetical protein
MVYLFDGRYSNYKLKIVKEKAFMISQILDEAKVDPTASGLGLAGFKKLLADSKQKREDDDSGKKGKKKTE